MYNFFKAITQRRKQIELYLSLVAKFVNLSNLIIKFIVNLFYNNLDNF